MNRKFTERGKCSADWELVTEVWQVSRPLGGWATNTFTALQWSRTELGRATLGGNLAVVNAINCGYSIWCSSPSIWLQNQENYPIFPYIPKPLCVCVYFQKSEIEVSAGGFLLRTVRERLSHASLPASGACRWAVAFLVLMEVSLQSPPSSSHGMLPCVHLSPCPNFLFLWKYQALDYSPP